MSFPTRPVVSRCTSPGYLLTNRHWLYCQWLLVKISRLFKLDFGSISIKHDGLYLGNRHQVSCFLSRQKKIRDGQDKAKLSTLQDLCITQSTCRDANEIKLEGTSSQGQGRGGQGRHDGQRSGLLIGAGGMQKIFG